MRNKMGWLIIITFIVLFTSCTPKGATSPTPTTTVNPASVAPPASNLSLPTSQDAAWQNIVEAAKKEGKLTDYSFNFTGDIGIALSRAFREKYGIQLEIVTGRGADFIERVKTERRMGSLMVDMSDGSAPNMAIMKNEGLTASIAGELPEVREKDVWIADILAMDPRDGHLITYTYTRYSPFINTSLVKPGEEPKVWKDFLDPKWKGKMTLIDPVLSSGPYQQFVPMMREKVIDAEFLKSLYKQDLMFVGAQLDQARAIAKGDRALSIQANNNSFGQFLAEGAPIRAINLTDGTPVTATILAAYKGAPHPNAARVFINWLISQEGQTVWGKAFGIANARKDVPNFAPEALRYTATRPVIVTNEDNDEAAKLYQERFLNKLWGR